MTDLSIVLPGFPTQTYARLIPSLEKNLVSTTDLLTLDAVEIAKRAKLPLLDVKLLCAAVLGALGGDLGVGVGVADVDGGGVGEGVDAVEGLGGEEGQGQQVRKKAVHDAPLRKTGKQILDSWSSISTLDDKIDAALGGGIPTGYITEVTGESGAGKTQFLLSLLLSTQLATPHGLNKSTLYISTESALPTTRLSQMLKTHPVLTSAHPKPSLDRIISIVTPDLESQDHILQYQLPVAVRRHNVGLVVLDSVAANYRAEFERPGATRNGANMAKRSSELVKLGHLLRNLARTENIAIVVANQVSDRFTSSQSPSSFRFNPNHNPSSSPFPSRPMPGQSYSSPLAHRTAAPNPHPQPHLPHTQESSLQLTTHSPLTLDHQQRWFTGWGDAPDPHPKTPSLGLVWTSQIACRVALIKRPVYGASRVVGGATMKVDAKMDINAGMHLKPLTQTQPQTQPAGGEAEAGEDGEETTNPTPTPQPQIHENEDDIHEKQLTRWRRWVKVVFAPWAPPSGSGVDSAVEFEITGMGIRACVRD